PLVFLPAPDMSELVVRSHSLLQVSSSTTLQPGIYNGGIAASSGAQITLAPGLYYLVNGGLSVGSHSNIAGAEVSFYLADASASTITIQGGGSAQLTPPADGFSKGMTIFMNRDNDSLVTITGGGNLQIYGSIYA